MKKVVSTVLALIGLSLFYGCAQTQTWPDHRPPSVEEPMIGDRIDVLQGRIDHEKYRLPASELRPLQFQLDGIRGDYLRMREGGRYPTHEEKTDISRRLDRLEKDLRDRGIYRER